MIRIINLLLLLVSAGCVIMLVLSPMDRATFFLTNSVGQWLFPKLDHYRRQQKFKFIAGIILASIIAAEVIYFLLKMMNRHPKH